MSMSLGYFILVIAATLFVGFITGFMAFAIRYLDKKDEYLSGERQGFYEDIEPVYVSRKRGRYDD